MFKPLPDNLIGTAENNTRYATELIVSDAIYTALLDIAGSWTYLCLIVGRELEVIKVTELLGANKIRVVRGVENTKRITLIDAVVRYLPTISSIYDNLSTLTPITIQAEGAIIVDGYSVEYPVVTLESDIDGAGTLVDGDTIVINEQQGYIGCTPYRCPTPTTPKFILTSRPYAAEAIEGITGSIKALRGSELYNIVEELSSMFSVVNADLYGGLKAFTIPVEAMDSTFSVIEAFLYGGLISLEIPPESMDSSFLVVSADLYGDLVTYSFGESMDSSFSVVSGALT